MAKEFDNTNSGRLFKNKKKTENKHPDYTGHLDVGGQEYWLSAWLNTDKNGEKYMRLTVKLKEESSPPPAKPAPANRGPAAVADMEDSIPF